MPEDFKRTIHVNASADAAFTALTSGFEHWWTKPDQAIYKVGDRAKFTFPPGVSYWTFEAMTLVPSRYVELECVDALHVHEGQPKEIEQEWLGSSLKWSISSEKDGAKIELEHTGLTPDLLCFDICQAGWDIFFTHSLKDYLNTSIGKPHKG